MLTKRASKRCRKSCDIGNFLFSLINSYTFGAFELIIFTPRGFHIDLPTYEDPKFNDLLSSVREQSTWKARTFTERNYFLIQDIFQLLIASSILFYASWWLALVVVVCTLPSLWVEAAYGRMVWTIWDSNAPIRRRYQDLNWRFSYPNSVIELRLFRNAGHFLKMCSDLFLKYRNNQRTYKSCRMRWQVAANAVSQTAYLQPVYTLLAALLS